MAHPPFNLLSQALKLIAGARFHFARLGCREVDCEVDTLVDATVRIYGAAGKEVAGTRTYTSENSNPTTFVVVPGSYRIAVQEIRDLKTEINASVEAEATVEKAVDFD